jgi:hypothetical protein
MKKTVLIIAGTGALSLAWLLLSDRPAPSPSAAEEAQPTPDSAAIRLSAPEPAAPPVAAPPIAAPTAAATASAATDKEAQEYVPDSDTQERGPELAIERREMLTRVGSENADPQWTAETVGRVQGLLAPSAAGAGALKEVDCRQTICRLTLRSASEKRADVKGLLTTARSIDEQTWMLPERQSDATFAIEVFFPRKDYRLSGGGGRIDEQPRMAELGGP